MSNLPNSWAKTKITEILIPHENGKPFQQGWSPRCENHPASTEQWGVLKTTAIQHGEFWGHENKCLPEHLEPRPHIEVKPGDVLMTCAGPRSRCGVACLVERTQSKLMMSGKMYRFRPNPEIMDAKYLTYFIQTQEAQLSIDQMKTGISDSGLNLTHGRFATLEVPIAPLQEQVRIVTKIEELFSKLESGAKSLAVARAKLKAYRQALLKNAFEGKLTSDWRETRGDLGSTGDHNLMTLEERASDELDLLPDSWEYVRLRELTDLRRPITYGVIKLGVEVEGGIPTLRSSDVRELRIDVQSVKRIAPDVAKKYARTFLRGGEVLITVRGTLGGVSVVPSNLAGWNISREVAMIAPTEDLDPFYLQFMLASPQLQAWFKGRVRGVAYTGINLETLKSSPVIFCSLDEQREIATLIDAKLTMIENSDREIEAQLTRIDVLRKSILKSAFSGSLVSQDPTEELASVLLERVKAEKPQKRKNKKSSKRKDAA